ncbi:YhgE/Pip domain-containing protein [Clostridium sp. C8-1-8]|uniref:YhgE/Pip domain-containing protein n=1 Tax=Clostridium sp. C8-1-8 TaxID=2698831 RepID=UPI00136D8FEA|nr:YhgE/Pip domain-containing protein [Clostridium sp. C8-1-8]
MQLKKAKDNRKFTLVIISVLVVAVMFVPMLYSSIYLGSVWDVYGRLDSVPVAFVNLDKSVTKDGKEYAIGKEVEDKLKDNNKVGWRFVSHEEAMDGVKGTKYYAVIEIPENFSQSISNAQDGKFNNPEITYTANKGKNFVFSQVSSKVAEGIKTEVSSSIQKEISKALVDSLYDVKVSIKDAGDGASKLQDGTQKLLDGGKTLTDGLGIAASGASKLEDGLKQAATGGQSLQAGTKQLYDGSNNLSSGITQASNGANDLKNGLFTLASGENQVLNGASKLVSGLDTLKQSLTAKNDKLPLLVSGASQLSDKTSELAQKTSDLNYVNFSALAYGTSQTEQAISSANSAISPELVADLDNSNMSEADKAKIKQIVGTVQKVDAVNKTAKISGHLSAMAEGVKPLPNAMEQLKQGSKNLSDGINQLVNGLSDTQNKASVGVDQLLAGAKALQSGSSAIYSGLSTAASKTGELSNGLQQLNTGSIALRDGLKTANDGAVSLSSGLNTAASKTEDLTNGLNKLSSGANTLTSGLSDANDGTSKLKDGLNSGYDKMSNKLKFNSENMSQFISEPITLKDNSINDVKYYGEGLAPYFMSLSLWLGAMFMSLILSIAKSKNLFKSKLMNSFFGKFIVGSGLVTMQAIILSLTVTKGLGIDPANILEFYMTNILIAVAFFSVMYGVSHAIGVLGGAVMFIVLLLQLASSGGTFPIETAPLFYKIINKVVPMTYSVSTLRMTISGINQSLLNSNMIGLLIFILVFLSGGFIVRAIMELGKNKKQQLRESEAA